MNAVTNSTPTHYRITADASGCSLLSMCGDSLEAIGLTLIPSGKFRLAGLSFLAGRLLKAARNFSCRKIPLKRWEVFIGSSGEALSDSLKLAAAASSFVVRRFAYNEALRYNEEQTSYQSKLREAQHTKSQHHIPSTTTASGEHKRFQQRNQRLLNNQISTLQNLENQVKKIEQLANNDQAKFDFLGRVYNFIGYKFTLTINAIATFVHWHIEAFADAVRSKNTLKNFEKEAAILKLQFGTNTAFKEIFSRVKNNCSQIVNQVNANHALLTKSFAEAKKACLAAVAEEGPKNSEKVESYYALRNAYLPKQEAAKRELLGLHNVTNAEELSTKHERMTLRSNIELKAHCWSKYTGPNLKSPSEVDDIEKSVTDQLHFFRGCFAFFFHPSDSETRAKLIEAVNNLRDLTEGSIDFLKQYATVSEFFDSCDFYASEASLNTHGLYIRKVDPQTGQASDNRIQLKKCDDGSWGSDC